MSANRAQRIRELEEAASALLEVKTERIDGFVYQTVGGHAPFPGNESPMVLALEALACAQLATSMRLAEVTRLLAQVAAQR